MSNKDSPLPSLPNTLKSIISQLTPRLNSVLSEYNIPESTVASIILNLTSNLDLSLKKSLPLLSRPTNPTHASNILDDLDLNLLHKYFNILSTLKQEHSSLQQNTKKLQSLQNSLKSGQQFLDFILNSNKK